MSSHFGHYLTRLREEKRPVRFVLSRLLRKSRMSTLLQIRRHGYKLHFHPTALSATLWLNPDERLDDEDFLAQYLKNGDLFVDIGANIGTLTLTGARLVGDTGHIYAFEAHPITAKYLKSNVELNAFNNITLANVALSDQPGEIGFSNLSSDDQNCVTQSASALKVPAIRLDDANLPKRGIALVKIDVEGYEKFVIAGAQETLARSDAIYFEASESAYQKFGYSFSDIHRQLEAWGFTLLQWEAQKARVLASDYQCTETQNILAVKDVNAFTERMKAKLVTGQRG